MHRLLRTTATVVTLIMLGSVSSTAAAESLFELSVKRNHFFGDSTGTLVFSAGGIEYVTTDKDDARRWTYDDVKQVQILSPTRLAVLTYEDRGMLRLGADRTFDFEVVKSAVSSELVTFLLRRVERPIVTAVMPQYGDQPLYRVRVKHQRHGRGSEGTLVMYDHQLVYLTEQEQDSRYWRFGDIDSVLRLDRFRLQVTVFEGGSGDTRTFMFELKSDLPEGFYDALWARVNPPGLEIAPHGDGRLAATVPK
jgi:hypothetical protein